MSRSSRIEHRTTATDRQLHGATLLVLRKALVGRDSFPLDLSPSGRERMLLDREASSFLGARWIQHVIHYVHGQYRRYCAIVEYGTDSDAPLSQEKAGIRKDSKVLGCRCICATPVERERRGGA
jgi:hypothetical protein